MNSVHSYFSKNQKVTLFYSSLALVVGLMAIDFINPSLPYIMKQLAVSQSATKGLMVVYMMALGISQLFYGSFSDNYGRRPAILSALLIAILGFLISAFSQNLTMLYIGRFLTALGTAGCPVIARAVISDVCHDMRQLKTAFSYFSMASQCSPALAPLLGGIIQQYANWHWSFVALAIINGITWILLYRFLEESHTIPLRKQTVWSQLTTYFALLRFRQFMIFNSISAMIGVLTIGYYSLTPFLFHVLGLSPVENALFYLLYAFSLALGALSHSTVFATQDPKKIFFITLILFPLQFCIFSIIFYFLPSITLVVLFSLITAFLCGISSPLAVALCMDGVSQDKGAASAVQSFVKFFFIGVALLIFNFVELQNFLDLTVIFLIISIVMIAFYVLERQQASTSK